MTPISNDRVDLFLNGEQLICTDMNVGGQQEPAYTEIEVLSPIVTYTINCGNTSVNSEYMVRQNTDDSHFVTVPVDVQYGDPSNKPVNIETESVNRVKFISSTILDPNTTAELKFQAVGTPSKTAFSAIHLRQPGLI